jgi:superfamily II DNA or RNA helicase
VEDIQVQRRQERARSTQYGIRNLGDHPIFARFAVESPSGKTYEVTIRSLKEHANSCTCPDFLTNLVGTCKHVEAVLLQVTPPDDVEGHRPLRPQVYLHYGEEVAVRLLWTPHPFGGGMSLQPLLERYFRPDGTFRGDLAKEFEGFRQAAEQSREIDIAPEVVSLVKDLREAALLAAERDQWLARLEKGEHLNVTALPLYPYQERGVLHLAYGRRSMLADDIGLGKTVQAIGAAELLRREGRVKRALVVCPASVRHQWKKEIFRFSGQEAAIVDGEDRAKIYERPVPYVISSYEQVVRDNAIVRTQNFDLIVLDEAQRIKDWRSRTTVSVKQLKSPFAFVLTGTTLEHRLDDLYSVMQFLDQRLLGPLWRFNQCYYVLDSQTKKPVGVKNLDELRSKLATVVMRRIRRDVQRDLPDRITKVFEIEMGTAQREAYDEARAAISRILAKTRPPTAVERDRIIRGLARMRMACSATELVSDATQESLSPKLQELERVLNDILDEAGTKVVIFSEWERMIQLAASLLARQQLDFLTLTGKVSANKRGELLEQFASDPRFRVLLSTDVIGSSVDVDAAAFVINLDVPWSPNRLEQRAAKVRSQSGGLTVINLVTRGSIEQAILALHDKKRTLHDSLTDEDAAVDKMPLPTLLGQPDLEMLKALVEPEPVDAVLAEVPRPEAAAVLAEFSQFLEPVADTPAHAEALTRGRSKLLTPQSVNRPRAPVGPHPGRPAGSLPADPVERHQVVSRIFAEALGTTFKDLVRLGAGFVLVVSRMESRVQVQANGVGTRLGIPILALDADGLRSLEQVIAPLSQGEAAPTAPAGMARQAAARCERSRLRLAEARCLLAGGLGPATVKATFEGMELALEALCLVHIGTAPPPADLMGELYGRLVKDGLVPLDLAAGVSRAKDLSLVADSRGRNLVDATVARAVLHDAESVLALANAKITT